MNERILMMPGHLINRAARHLQRIGEEKFQPLGLGIAQMPVLAALRDGRSLSQMELARLANVEQPTMAQLLARMERDGLIRRMPNPEDRRSSLITLTRKAQARLPQAREVLLEGNRIAVEGLSRKEVAALRSLLDRVNANLDAYRRQHSE